MEVEIKLNPVGPGRGLRLVYKSEVDGLAKRCTNGCATNDEDFDKIKLERDFLKSIIDEQIILRVGNSEKLVRDLQVERDTLKAINTKLRSELDSYNYKSETYKNESLKNQRKYYDKKHSDLIKQNEVLKSDNERLKSDNERLTQELEDAKQKLSRQIGITEGFEKLYRELIGLRDTFNTKLDTIIKTLNSNKNIVNSTVIEDLNQTCDNIKHQSDKIIMECDKIFTLQKQGLGTKEIASIVYPGLARGPSKVSERRNSDYYRSLN